MNRDLTNTTPDPHYADWIDFLRWMAGSARSSEEIVDVVEKPHNYEDEYREYLAEGGVNR